VNAREFEVATLKLSAPEQTGVRVNIALGGLNNGMVTMKNVTLGPLLPFDKLDRDAIGAFNHRGAGIAPWMDVVEELHAFTLEPCHGRV
jgi:hypothetical protein